MRITTDGITNAVGALIVGALAAGSLAVLRADAEDGPSQEADPCLAQERADAQQAQRDFRAQFAKPEPGEPPNRWYVDDDLSDPDAANRAIGDAERAGLPASGPLPAAVGEGWVLLVRYDPDRELPPLPSCLNDTPVGYVGADGAAALD